MGLSFLKRNLLECWLKTEDPPAKVAKLDAEPVKNGSDEPEKPAEVAEEAKETVEVAEEAMEVDDSAPKEETKEGRVFL